MLQTLGLCCKDFNIKNIGVAFIDVTNTPAMNALKTVSDISFPRSGAIALNPATCIPIELGLANPHKARI